MEVRIGIIRRCEHQYVGECLEKYGLQPMEGQILYLLRDCCSKQEDLCGRINLDKGRIARTLAHLEEIGLVTRTVNSRSRREKLVELTEEGEKMLNIIYGIYKDWENICYQGFSQEERDVYMGYLTRIADNIKDYKRGGYVNG